MLRCFLRLWMTSLHLLRSHHSSFFVRRPDRWDEWISFDSPRVAPFRSRTVHSTLTPYLSPTPNVSLARAPVTGANDLRTLLPEVARMFRVLQPIIENAAELAEQVMSHFPLARTQNCVLTPSFSQHRVFGIVPLFPRTLLLLLLLNLQ